MSVMLATMTGLSYTIESYVFDLGSPEPIMMLDLLGYNSFSFTNLMQIVEGGLSVADVD